MIGMRTQRVYILGAGIAGVSIANEIRRKGVFGEVAAFLDDDTAKIGTRIEGTPVLGPIEDILPLLDSSPGDEALIAMPSAPRERLRKLYGMLEQIGFSRIRILPGISQILEGDAHLIQTREIDPLDVLSRTPVQIHLRESLAYLRGKRVLITGAGGSIGSEIARQLLSGGCERIYLLGHGENSIYEIDHELRMLQKEGVGEQATIVPVIGELQDADYVHFIMQRLRADVIFHCAAYKHVPLMEANPVAVIRNNVFGTRNLLDAAREYPDCRIVLVSTDKVVAPSSVYGASKQLAEQLVLHDASGRHLAVRFGNVLGSRGSILPLFRRQIESGGPVTLTHPDATRFFMTIPEAVSLVLKAGGVGNGGELYLLDMGEPVRIRDVAEQLIRFYGYEPDVDIPIDIIGLRPGEKLQEALWDDHETPQPTEFPRIQRITRTPCPAEPLQQLLQELTPVCTFDPAQPRLYRDRRRLRDILRRYVPTLQEVPDEPRY
ncbi:polysaccharide biosynthesis protein [Spirochaeta africana]|uniref:Putative nucleoside-diphosphate sugar epimerase n=1 Tax=Spirochaeta africana (strain ATCC 700263 / DSM 8902 / Z-7692) TaxID=889378 RepID=H9UL63_SPIAZ|nr:nucleoside-diphosphate sugar epimerase/dehydratase [Spirochaeta africana]AFG38256.1 putative nucleoside-diphosphate sugar epimerase [Spirochaeta africana DSM 8902]